MALTTRKMSDRHEHDLVAMLGGERTRNSGAVWSDQGDGHQTGLDQHWRFGWDGKSTLGKSIGVTRDMLAKLREQCRGLEPMLPMRWYADERLTMVDEDWIAVEAETFVQILDEANAYRALLADDQHQIEFRDDGFTIRHSMQERIEGDIFDCAFNAVLAVGPDKGLRGRFYVTLDDDGRVVIGDEVEEGFDE